MFSTNLEPEDLMDPAFHACRLPYKIEIWCAERGNVQEDLCEGLRGAPVDATG